MKLWKSKKFKIEVGQSFLFFAIGACLFLYALKQQSRIAIAWAMSPYLFPLLISVFLLLLAFSLMRETIRNAKAETTGGELSSDGKAEEAKGELFSNTKIKSAQDKVLSNGKAGAAGGELPSDGKAETAEGELPSDGKAGAAEGDLPSDGKAGAAQGELRFDGKAETGLEETVQNSGAESSRPYPMKFWLSLVGIFLYYLAMPYLGFLIASVLFLAAMLWLLGERRWQIVLLLSAGTALTLYGIFHELLHVLLP